MNLTSIRDPHSIVRLHFLDSLAVGSYLDDKACLADIGSGAGFPGLPLKIAFPEKEVMLVESKRKKASFLTEAVRQLRLRGISVMERRLENLQQEGLRFDESITRAFSDPYAFLTGSYSILAGNGKSFIMQGPKGVAVFNSLAPKLKALGYRDAHLHRFRLPLGTEERTLLVFLK